jgi:4-azaleucine resistance transporter AzlC
MSAPDRDQPDGMTGGPAEIGLTILFGYFFIAIAFGAAGRAAGLAAAATAGFSVFVFAGASQFMAVSLIGQGAGAVSIIAATLVLNLRHVVMSMTLRNRIEGSSVPRPLLAFGITDEVFAAFAARRGPIRDTHLLVTEALAYAGWVGGTIVGYLAGGVLPEQLEQAMGIALYAMFVALIIPPIRRFPKYAVPALAAGALNWGLQAIGVPVGVALLISIPVVAIGFAAVPGWSD